MRALVVYESMFGNTMAIAEVIAKGLERRLDVRLAEVGSAPSSIPDDLDLLVVGGPTHGHGMTTPDSRADAARRAGDRLVSQGNGIREWTGAIRPGTRVPLIAVFDTRIKGPALLWGSAAKGAEKALHGAGFTSLRPPESFLVDGPTGSLFDRLVHGELDRARLWGEELALAFAAREATAVPA